MISALLELISVVFYLKRIIKDFWYTISISDPDLVWRMQLMIIRG